MGTMSHGRVVGGTKLSWKTLFPVINLSPSDLLREFHALLSSQPTVHRLHPGVPTFLQLTPAHVRKRIYGIVYLGCPRAIQAWLDPKLNQGLQGTLCLLSLFCFPLSVGLSPQLTFFTW